MSVLSMQVDDPRHVVASGKAISNPNASYNKKQRENTCYLLPRSAPPSTMLTTGGGEAIFDLPYNAVDELDMLFLCFTLTNQNGAGGALHPLDGYSMIDTVEVLDRGLLAQVQYGQGLRKTMLLTTPSEKAMILKAANINPVTNGPLNTIADGASLTFRIAIPTLLDTTKMPMWREEHQWRIVIKFRGSTDVLATTSVASAAQVSISEVKLLIDGIQFQEDVRAAMDRELESLGDIYYKYIDGTRDQLTLGATTDGIVTQQNYQQVGNLSFAFLDLRAAGSTNQSQYAALDLDTFELVQNGRVTNHGLGDNEWTYEISKLHAASHWSNPQVLETHNTCIVSFSDHPELSLATGSNHGIYRLNGNSEIWRITPGATGASNILWVYGYWHSYMVCNYKEQDINIQRKPLEY